MPCGGLSRALFTDLYQLTMAQAYWQSGATAPATFSLFFRSYPPDRSYFVFAGLANVLEYLERFRFTGEDIEGLRSLGKFDGEFLNYLAKLRFRGSVRAMREGSLFFVNEPVIEVTAPVIEAQIVETFLLNQVNVQSVLATKASRVVYAARGRSVVDFAARRTHGTEAADEHSPDTSLLEPLVQGGVQEPGVGVYLGVAPLVDDYRVLRQLKVAVGLGSFGALAAVGRPWPALLFERGVVGCVPVLCGENSRSLFVERLRHLSQRCRYTVATRHRQRAARTEVVLHVHYDQGVFFRELHRCPSHSIQPRSLLVGSHPGRERGLTRPPRAGIPGCPRSGPYQSRTSRPPSPAT